MNAHHFTFCPKFRRPVLVEPVRSTIFQLIHRMAQLKGYDILAINTDIEKPDHIHILLDLPRAVSPAEAARNIKWFSSVHVRRIHPETKRIHDKAFWQRRYFSRSIGGDRRAVEKYVADQGKNGIVE